MRAVMKAEAAALLAFRRALREENMDMSPTSTPASLSRTSWKTGRCCMSSLVTPQKMRTGAM